MLVTIDIGNHELRLVSFEGNQVLKWGTAPLAPGLVTDGHILQPQSVADIIGSLLKSRQISGSPVYVTLNGISFTYRVVRLPRMKSAQMQEAVERAAAKEIPLPLEDLYLSWQAVDIDEDEADVFILGVPRTFIDALVETMRLAGVKLAGVDLKGLTLARAAGKANALLVDFETDCFDIVIVVDGMTTILHTVNHKADGVTIEDSVRHLIDELTRTVDFYNITHSDNPIKSNMPLVLSGKLAADETTRRLIQVGVEYPLEQAVPQARFPADFPVGQYISNIGLALKPPPREIPPHTDISRFYDINLNLLDGKRRLQTRKATPLERYLPSIVIVAVVILIALLFVRNRMQAETFRLTTQVDRIERELKLTRIRIDAANQTEATINKLLNEVETLKLERQSITGRGVPSSRALQALVDKLHNKGSLTSIQVDTKEITIDGQMNNRADVIAYAYALDNLKIFAEVRIARIDEPQGGNDPATKVDFSIVMTR